MSIPINTMLGPSDPKTNSVVVERLVDFNGFDIVLYTKISSNIHDITPTKLAKLAIGSAKAEAGKNGKDGISYLISLKKYGIATPLMPAYESEILRSMNAPSLDDALRKCRGNV